MSAKKNTIDHARKFLPTRFKRMLSVCLAFVLYYLVFYILDPYRDSWQDYFHRDFLELLLEWLGSFLFCFVISETSIFIHKKLNNQVPWKRNKSKRLFLEIFFNFCAVVLLVLVNMLYVNWSYSKLNNGATPIWEIKGMLQWIVISLVISFMMISVNTVSYLINNWIDTSVEVSQHKIQAAELRQASVEAELNALKLQLDPHFIFNNLSVLSELILENQQLGFEYSENFAKVYKFLLVNSKNNVIPLEEELKFLDAYVFLIKHRVGNGVNFSINISGQVGKLYIPPLTLQLLIENAIKHNATRLKKPLIIKIYSLGERTIVVENNLSKVNSSEMTSTGIGIRNIVGRFELLGQKPPVIYYDESMFKVSIELIEYDK